MKKTKKKKDEQNNPNIGIRPVPLQGNRKKRNIEHCLHCLCECEELDCGYICICEPESTCIACGHGRMDPCEIDYI